MKNKNLSITAILGMLAVVFGAFGAHVLKDKLDPSAFDNFETAIRYQMYHVIVLLIVNCYAKFSVKTKNQISYLLFAGIVCFSGSLYAISVLNVNPKSIWFITPLGGLLFILAWVKLSISFFRAK